MTHSLLHPSLHKNIVHRNKNIVHHNKNILYRNKVKNLKTLRKETKDKRKGSQKADIRNCSQILYVTKMILKYIFNAWLIL
jgi:hypothetical protein